VVRWKHALLGRYLPKFAGILGSYHPVIYFVDGFAGAGRYAGDHDGAPSVEGSPLLAARLASEIAGSGKWHYTLRCINVEHDKDVYANLCAATAPFQSPLVTNLRGTFRQHFNTVLDRIRLAPALFFLDPFGYTGMEWDLIAQLAERAKTVPTEVIINFLIDEIDQAAGWVDSRKQKAAPAFVRRVDQLYGTEQWREIVLSERPTAERKQRLTRLYQERVSAAFGFAARYNVRANDGSIRYALLYGTHHRRGARAMSDVVYQVEKDYSAARIDFETGFCERWGSCPGTGRAEAARTRRGRTGRHRGACGGRILHRAGRRAQAARVAALLGQGAARVVLAPTNRRTAPPAAMRCLRQPESNRVPAPIAGSTVRPTVAPDLTPLRRQSHPPAPGTPTRHRPGTHPCSDGSAHLRPARRSGPGSDPHPGRARVRPSPCSIPRPGPFNGPPEPPLRPPEPPLRPLELPPCPPGPPLRRAEPSPMCHPERSEGSSPSSGPRRSFAFGSG
jgi:three-Cys-motif partner protein